MTHYIGRNVRAIHWLVVVCARNVEVSDEESVFISWRHHVLSASCQGRRVPSTPLNHWFSVTWRIELQIRVITRSNGWNSMLHILEALDNRRGMIYLPQYQNIYTITDQYIAKRRLRNSINIMRPEQYAKISNRDFLNAFYEISFMFTKTSLVVP